MSRRLLVLNALVGIVACLLAVGLVRELVTSRQLPAPPAPRPAQAATAPVPAAAPPAGAAASGVIVTKNLFSPSRAEAPAGPVVAAAPKPLLHGIVMDGPKSRAYLEDPAAGRTFGYGVGDTVAGGRLQSISVDRVIITRPDGRLEVLLQDPSKPRAVSAPNGSAPAAPAGDATSAAPITRRPPAAAQGGRQ